MTDALPPLDFVWNGEAMSPSSPHWARRADQTYVIGQRYALVPHEDRSRNSHNHYFAELSEAWKNLPERWSARLPTPEHLRAYALIRTGYADSRTFIARSALQARDLRDFMRPCDPFSVVQADACTVTVWTAQSQSMRAMGKAKFQASKTAVLDFVAEMIGTTRAALTENTREAA